MNNIHSEIIQTKKRELSFDTRILRKGSVVVAYYLSKIGITALQVLFFRVFVFGWGSLYFFYSSNYQDNLIGLFLIAACYFLDQVDGDLARNYDRVTKSWGFLDANFDAIVLNSIILTFTIKFLNTWEDTLFVIAGIGILFGTILSTKMTELFQNHFDIWCWQGSARIEAYRKVQKLDLLSYIFYRLITPRGFPFSIFSNFRDYLLIGVLFQGMPYAILFFAIAINIRWIVLFILVAFYYNSFDLNSKHSKIAMFRLLRESEK